MRFLNLIIIFLNITSSLCAQSDIENRKDTFPVFGIEKVSSAFFRDRYLQNDLVNYLDNYNDFITYQSETTGNFNMPDQLIFSVSGNSHKWNKYYIDDFRIENRFSPGSVSYVPDLNTLSLNIDYNHSVLKFNSDSLVKNSIALRYNVGGFGGISPLTKELINLFHSTASERMYKPFEYRKKMKGAANLFLNYNLVMNEKNYLQQVYADFGTRMLTGFDETGISKYYPESFGKIQLSGELPGLSEKIFDKTNYLINISSRQNLYTELNFSEEESAKNNSFNASIWGSKENSGFKYTSGFTFTTDILQHNNLNFSRNVIDQDGEAFEPWYPDGNTSTLSHALNIRKKITKGLEMKFEGYNSLLNFKPEYTEFTNPVYARHTLFPYTSLYIYEWESKPFTSGILENTLSFIFQENLTKKLNFKAGLDFTMDGILLSEESMFKPNFQLQAGLQYRPVAWFGMDINIARKRVTYNYDDIRYLSNDYMNGNIYFWNDINNNQKFDNGEKSDFFTTTGGKYRTMAKELKQPSYFLLDIPVYFKFGRHKISLFHSYKKYVNFGITRFDKNADNYGFYISEDDNEIYIRNKGVVNYVIENYPDEYMNTSNSYNFATNSPFYFSSIVKYEYIAEKFFFSFSWCSHIMTGISSLGNGPLHNNIGVYSETTANPNNEFKILGRLDQDRAYIARMLFSYDVSDRLSFAVSGKFKDGQPFTNFDTKIYTDESGNNQITIWNKRTKGINPFDGDFGSRKDAFFNFDLRAKYQLDINKLKMEFQAVIYNFYDFGTELHEYTFDPTNIKNRYALELNIPRGLMFTTKVYF